MRIPNDALVIVADGQKALFLRHQDEGLVVEKKEVRENPPTREQAANRRGRMFDGSSGHRSAVDDTDWHELEKDRFAEEIADMLYARAHKGDFKQLILIATPDSLGEIRRHLHQEVAEKLIGEIAKDLTNHPIDEIAKVIDGQ
jgi:protein required for attachment to host cells